MVDVRLGMGSNMGIRRFGHDSTMGNLVRLAAVLCLGPGTAALNGCGARFEAKETPRGPETDMRPNGDAGTPTETPSSSPGSGGGAAAGSGAATAGTTATGGKQGSMPPVAEGGKADAGEAGASGAGGAPDEIAPQLGLLPVAAQKGDWMWQSQQTRLRDASGKTCTAKLTLAVGPGAACFTDSQDQLVCSGVIDTHSYGPGFQPVGLKGVDQILLAPAGEGGAICVHTRAGTVQCMGSYNDWGQFGGGVKGTASTFVTWGRANLVGFGSGTWDQMCALDQQGVVACSGYNFGSSPVLQPGSGHHSVWVNTSGEAKVDDADVLRAGEGRTACVLTAARGLLCEDTGYGKPGHIVAGGMGSAWEENHYDARPCWLDDKGHVECAGYPAAPFEDQIVLALATNYYAKDICAVLQDGAVDCVRGNLDSDHLRAPAGSALIDCN